MNRLLAILLSITVAGTASATPKVVTTISPVQGLVEDIMMGAGKPTLLMQGAISPHNFSLRPSQARELAEADVVFAMGLGLDSWLSETGNAAVYYLGTAESLKLYKTRELKEFSETDGLIEAHDHEDELDHSLEYSAEEEVFDASDPAVDAFINELIGDSEPIGMQTTDTYDDHGHGAGATDPHIWLDPQNTLILIDAITATLISIDLVNEEIYRDNATRLKQDVVRAVEASRFAFDRLSDIDIITTHDSLQYLERAFDLHVIGALSSGTGSLAGARSLSGIYEQVGPKSCILVDISHPAGIGNNPFGEVPTIEIDPLGTMLVGTAGYYPRLLETLAETISNCR